MLHLDDRVASVQLVYRMLCEVARHPSLIVLNMALGAAVLLVSIVLSRLVSKRNRLAWTLGLGVLLVGVWFCYFPEYPPAEYYKEADVPEGQFAHMVLLRMFPLMPLFAVFGYIAGGIRPLRFRGGVSPGATR